MGTTQSSPFKDQLSSYKQLQKYPQNNMTFLSHLQTNQQFLLLQHTYNDEQLYKKSLDLHKLRQTIAQQHLTRLNRIQGKQIDHLCSSLYKIYALWQYPHRTLHQQITQRSYQNRKFQDKQLWSILASAILALSTLQKNKIKHQIINTKTILLDDDGLIKIVDPLSLGSVTNMDTIYRNRNTPGLYLSPQQCQSLQSRAEYNNSYKNDVWTIGMILLECALLKNQSNCYKDQYQRIDYQLIQQNLEEFGNNYGHQLQFITQLMLKKDNKDRPDWIDLQQHTRKTTDKQNLNSSPNQQSPSKNGSNFTPKSNKQALSSFSPQQPLFNKLQDPPHNIPQTLQQNRQFIQNIYSPPPSNSHIIYNQPIQYQQMHPSSPYVFYPQYKSNINNSNNINPPHLLNTATFPTPSSVTNNYMPIMNSIHPIQSTQPYNSNLIYPSPNATFKNIHQTQYINKPVSIKLSTVPPQPSISTQPTNKYQSWKTSLPQQNMKNTKIGTSIPYFSNQIQLLKNDHYKSENPLQDYKSNYTTSPHYLQFNQTSSPSKYSSNTPRISNPNYYNSTTNPINPINNNYNANPYLFSNKNQYPSNLFTSPSLLPPKSLQSYSTSNQPKLSKQQQFPKTYNPYSTTTNNITNLNKIQQDNYISQPTWKNYLSSQPKNQPKLQAYQSYPSNTSSTYNQNQTTQKNYLGIIQTQSLNYQNSYQDKQKLSYIVQNFKQGSRYQGFKLKDMRHGQGKFYYQDGGMYDGNWSRNRMDGYGSLYYQSGQLAYQGMWQQDQFQGHGKLYNQSPHKLTQQFNYRDFDLIDDYWQYYQGDFIQDYKKGKGKLMLSNGQYFQGTFNDDFIQGPGTFFCKNGDVIRGIWNNNHLIQK